MVIAWSNSLITDFIETAPTDNILVNKSRGEINGLHMSRLKWWKMAKYSIFGHFSLFLPRNGQPLCSISTFIDKNVITGCCCNDIYNEKITPGYYHSIFLTFAWKLNFWSFLAIFSPFVPTRKQPLYYIYAFIDESCCNVAVAMILSETESL